MPAGVFRDGGRLPQAAFSYRAYREKRLRCHTVLVSHATISVYIQSHEQ